jgi:hypothetical protein
LSTEQLGRGLSTPLQGALLLVREDAFIVFLKNQSGRDQLVSPSSVTASYLSSDGTPSEVVVFSYDDLVQKEKRQQAWGAVAAGLGSVGDSLSATSAGYGNTYGNYSGSTYSSSGSSYNSYGNYSSTTYDYGAANAARLAADTKRDAEFSRLASQGSANLASLARSSLKKQTVPSGRSYGGSVTMKMPKFQASGTLRIDVRVGSERHSFQFTVEKPKR